MPLMGKKEGVCRIEVSTPNPASMYLGIVKVSSGPRYSPTGTRPSNLEIPANRDMMTPSLPSKGVTMTRLKGDAFLDRLSWFSSFKIGEARKLLVYYILESAGIKIPPKKEDINHKALATLWTRDEKTRIKGLKQIFIVARFREHEKELSVIAGLAGPSEAVERIEEIEENVIDNLRTVDPAGLNESEYLRVIERMHKLSKKYPEMTRKLVDWLGEEINGRGTRLRIIRRLIKNLAWAYPTQPGVRDVLNDARSVGSSIDAYVTKVEATWSQEKQLTRKLYSFKFKSRTGGGGAGRKIKEMDRVVLDEFEETAIEKKGGPDNELWNEFRKRLRKRARILFRTTLTAPGSSIGVQTSVIKDDYIADGCRKLKKEEAEYACGRQKTIKTFIQVIADYFQEHAPKFPHKHGEQDPKVKVEVVNEVLTRLDKKPVKYEEALDKYKDWLRRSRQILTPRKEKVHKKIPWGPGHVEYPLDLSDFIVGLELYER